MERISIEPFCFDQKRVLFWGVLCGYCGDKPGMPVCFLAGNMCTLNDEERADVLEHVEQHIGPVKRTRQNEVYFRVLDNRRHSAGQRQADPESPVP